MHPTPYNRAHAAVYALGDFSLRRQLAELTTLPAPPPALPTAPEPTDTPGASGRGRGDGA